MFALKRKGANLYERDRNNARSGAVINGTARPSTTSIPLAGSSAGVRATPSVGIQE